MLYPRRLAGRLLRRSLRELSDADESGKIRRAVLRRHAPRVSARVVKQSEAYKVPLLRFDDLESGSDVMYILGSGSSVEDLEPDHFERVSRGYSIGVNSWPLHDFIPSAYSLEQAKDGLGRTRAIRHCLSRREIKDAQPKIMLYTEALSAPQEQRPLVPPDLQAQCRVYSALLFQTVREAKLPGAISDALSEQSHSDLGFPVAVGGASIARLASIGILAGYKNIVFVGVDLNHTNYFWERNPSYLRKRGLQELHHGQHGGTHKTNHPLARFRMVQIISALAEAASTQFGTRLWVSNPRSALSEVIGVYDWGSA